MREWMNQRMNPTVTFIRERMNRSVSGRIKVAGRFVRSGGK